jgi:CO/xanthine dehydrogenase FAD-binding subunit
MRIADFRIPEHLDEARTLLKGLGDQALPLAGGTSLVFAVGRDEKIAVDLMRAGLDGIRREHGGFRIGATTRLADLQHFRADGWVLDRVAVRLASQQVRNMSTIGGNIVRVFPWADFPVALLALDASLVILGQGERTVGADEFFAGQPSRLLKGGDLLAAVHVKALPPGTGFGYRKETRAAMGFSLMTAAALVESDGKNIRRARVAAGAGVPFPCRLEAVEAALAGKPGKDETFREAAKGTAGLKIRTSAGMSEEYIAHLAQVVVADALREAWTEAVRA